eukprot:2636814-Pyramimonas_sp.AAC.1
MYWTTFWRMYRVGPTFTVYVLSSVSIRYDHDLFLTRCVRPHYISGHWDHVGIDTHTTPLSVIGSSSSSAPPPGSRDWGQC